MKHICIVFWDLGIGGIQTRIKSIVSRIVERDPNVLVTVILYERKPHEVPIVPHPRIHFEVFPGPIYFRLFGFKKKFWRFTTFQLIVWLCRVLLRLKPIRLMTFLNRFSFFLLPYVLFARLIQKDFRFIINEPVVVSEYLRKNEPRWWYFLMRFTYSFVDKILVAAHAVKKDLVRNFHVPKQKVVVVKSWVSHGKS